MAYPRVRRSRLVSYYSDFFFFGFFWLFAFCGLFSARSAEPAVWVYITAKPRKKKNRYLSFLACFFSILFFFFLNQRCGSSYVSQLGFPSNKNCLGFARHYNPSHKTLLDFQIPPEPQHPTRVCPFFFSGGGGEIYHPRGLI